MSAMLWFLAGAVAGAVTALVVVVALAARAVVRIALACAPKPTAPATQQTRSTYQTAVMPPPAPARQWSRDHGWTCTPGFGDVTTFDKTSRKN